MGTPSSLKEWVTWSTKGTGSHLQLRKLRLWPQGINLGFSFSSRNPRFLQASKLSLLQHLDWRPSTAPFPAGTLPWALNITAKDMNQQLDTKHVHFKLKEILIDKTVDLKSSSSDFLCSLLNLSNSLSSLRCIIQGKETLALWCSNQMAIYLTSYPIGLVDRTVLVSHHAQLVWLGFP